MNQNFILVQYLSDGIENIVKKAIKSTLGNPRETIFFAKYAEVAKKAAQQRDKYESAGVHIPPFLISSIASSCNLHCEGCYSRAYGGCGNTANQSEMSLEDWRNVFKEASDIGVSFILLAGGEPLLRRDIIELASNFDNIIFPIFTNGTMIDRDYIALFDKHRNLIPVLSIEGDEAKTDKRRGKGVSERVWNTAKSLKSRGVFFGTSITVTCANRNDVTDKYFVNGLREHGCGLIFYIEYVPVEKNTRHLVLSDKELQELQIRIDLLRNDETNKEIIILSFPGDEEEIGGCLAAGRGFFHINASGGAEPCPFSPYSEMNLKEQTLLSVLQSSFFEKIRDINAAEVLPHKGGCTLFQIEDKVKQTFGSNG